MSPSRLSAAATVVPPAAGAAGVSGAAVVAGASGAAVPDPPSLPQAASTSVRANSRAAPANVLRINEASWT
jgi:hypothetical protein